MCAFISLFASFGHKYLNILRVPFFLCLSLFLSFSLRPLPPPSSNYHPWTLCTRTSSHTNTTVTVHTPIIRLIIVLSVHALSFRGTFYPLIILLICFWYTLIGSLESPPALFFFIFHQSWFLIFSRRKKVFNLCINFRMMSIVDGAWYWIYRESRRWIWKKRMCLWNFRWIRCEKKSILSITASDLISFECMNYEFSKNFRDFISILFSLPLIFITI